MNRGDIVFISDDKEKNEWYAALDSMGDGVIVTDLESKISYMNKFAQNLTGWSIMQAQNKALKSVFNIKNQEDKYLLDNKIKYVKKKIIRLITSVQIL